MFKPTFNSSILKLGRAIEHRNALDDFKQRLFRPKRNRPRLGIRFEPDSGEHVLYVSQMPNIDDALDQAALILGDALNNLRSALDHLVFELARWHTNDNIPNIRQPQFVIADTEDSWAYHSNRRLGFLHPNHVAVIKSFQPNIGFDGDRYLDFPVHSLALLADLNDTDKHRLLPVLAVPGNSIHAAIPEAYDLFVKGYDIMTLGGSGHGGYVYRIELDTEIVRAAMPPTFPKNNVKVAGYVVPEIALPEGRPAIAVCDKIANFVTRIIERFGPLAK